MVMKIAPDGANKDFLGRGYVLTCDNYCIDKVAGVTLHCSAVVHCDVVWVKIQKVVAWTGSGASLRKELL